MECVRGRFYVDTPFAIFSFTVKFRTLACSLNLSIGMNTLIQQKIQCCTETRLNSLWHLIVKYQDGGRRKSCKQENGT